MCVVYVRGACAWCMCVVYVRGVCVWCMCVVYVRGACAWCMCVVYVRGVCDLGERTVWEVGRRGRGVRPLPEEEAMDVAHARPQPFKLSVRDGGEQVVEGRNVGHGDEESEVGVAQGVVEEVTHLQPQRGG
jgi:hypothetical protein